MTTSPADLMVELHADHARALWGFALRLVGGDRAKAEDVVQETLLRAWRDRTVLESTTAGARAWLFTVARRLVIDDWRSSRAHREVLADETALLGAVPAPKVREAQSKVIAVVRKAEEDGEITPEE